MRNFRLGLRFAAAITVCMMFESQTIAQSTFASIVGTVRDASGAVVAKSIVDVANTGTSARRETITAASGDYLVTNLEPGTYRITIKSPGFQDFVRQIELTARETLRADAQMAVAGQSQTVSVEAEVPTINTEVSNIAETKSGRELIDLPIAIATRANGSTSPISTLTSQPGVQTDANGNISVAGDETYHAVRKPRWDQQHRAVCSIRNRRRTDERDVSFLQHHRRDPRERGQ